MKEHSYRVWHKEWKMMVEPKDIISFDVCDGILCGVKFYLETTDGVRHEQVWEDDPENIVFLQDTGLKDKQGKEIYEGDIVQRPFQLDTQLSVKFHSGAFYAHYQCGDARFDDYIPIHKGEWRVIGNIYENPDLLKQ